MLMKIRKGFVAAIDRIEKNPNAPAGVYFGVFVLYWAISALSNTHLVDAKMQFLPQVPALSNVTYATFCHGVLCIAALAGGVAVVVVPLAMVCARKFRVAMKTLVVGCGSVDASIVFAFLTSPLLFFISIEVDQWAR